jgi:hypothetical protein
VLEQVDNAGDPFWWSGQGGAHREELSTAARGRPTTGDNEGLPTSTWRSGRSRAPMGSSETWRLNRSLTVMLRCPRQGKEDSDRLASGCSSQRLCMRSGLRSMAIRGAPGR